VSKVIVVFYHLLVFFELSVLYVSLSHLLIKYCVTVLYKQSVKMHIMSTLKSKYCKKTIF